jgi:hypothetical protein
MILRPLCANNGPTAPQQKACLFDHLIYMTQQRKQHGEYQMTYAAERIS